MRIITWNIHGARDAPVAQIAREIASHHADVVCLNEVRRRHGKRLGRALGLRAFVASSFIGPYGTAILTNEPVSAWRRFRFPGVRRIERRDASLVTLAEGSTIAAVHFGLRAPERLRNAAELLEALPDRAIITGDMNETPRRAVAQLFAARFDDAGLEADDPTFPAAARCPLR
jgi:endonuclease/exonuclease/phosphatase family metal-dependent hydrolase